VKSSGAIRILLVDDDPVFTLLACQLMETIDVDFSVKVTTLTDGQVAMKELRQGRFDLALLDYNLPGATGLEVLADIQSYPVARQPAVIMLTASGNEAIAVEAMKQGAKDYVRKVDLDGLTLTRAIQNALNQKRLTDQVEIYHAKLDADLEMARKLQVSLLPQRYPTFPESASPSESALQFHHRFSWTTQLSGDFFSVQKLSETQVGVLICDVMGHGVRSALVTAMLRALVGDMAPEAGHPDRFLSGMNQRLNSILKEVGETLFATAFYMVADVGAGKLHYARAGHPSPIHLRAKAGQVAPLPFPKSPGPALGLFSDAAYIACEQDLESGDLLLLFTDGLFEVTSSEGEEFGAERLLESVRRRRELPMVQVVDALIEEVLRFCGDEEFADDVCLLGVDVRQAIMQVSGESR
jgi:sigma-B regulation protein RsbU (phosphoserine phosphatase)